MDFTVPQFAIYIASWLGLIGGVWALFDRAETVVSPDVKVAISQWLTTARVPRADNGSRYFYQLFVAVFGHRHLSWRCAILSVFSSVVFLTITTGIWIAMNPEYAHDQLLGSANRTVGLFLGFVILNLIPDYFSLWETRIILKAISKTKSAVTSGMLVVIDLLVTFGIFYGAFAWMIHFIDHWQSAFDIVWSGVFMTSPREKDFSVGPFLYTTFATSIWLWLYILSGVTSRALHLSDAALSTLKKCLDIDNKPIRSIGFVSMLIVTVPYVIFPLASGIAN